MGLWLIVLPVFIYAGYMLSGIHNYQITLASFAEVLQEIITHPFSLEVGMGIPRYILLEHSYFGLLCSRMQPGQQDHIWEG